MTMRVEISIIPLGDESRKRVIETFNISNITFEEGPLNGKDHYVVEHNDYKNYSSSTPRVEHRRSDGAIQLVIKALKNSESGGA